MQGYSVNAQTRSKQDETCTAEGYTTSAVVSLPREGLVKLGGPVFADPGLLLGQLVWVRNDVHLQGIYMGGRGRLVQRVGQGRDR